MNEQIVAIKIRRH